MLQAAEEQFYALEAVVSLWLDGSWHDLPPAGIAKRSVNQGQSGRLPAIAYARPSAAR